MSREITEAWPFGELRGYGVLENEATEGWEARFRDLLAPGYAGRDETAPARPRPPAADAPGDAAETPPPTPGFIERLAHDDGFRQALAPRVIANTKVLAAAAGDDDVALQVLGVLFLAAGVALPPAAKARVLGAFDREVVHDRAEEEFSGWNHWSMRTGILRVVRDLVERGDAGPVYAGGEAMWALSDTRDLDGFLLTSLGSCSTGLPRIVCLRMCRYGEVEEGCPVPQATLAVIMHKASSLGEGYAVVTVEEPVHQVYGPALPADELDRLTRWIALNREALLAHWLGRTCSSELIASCKALP